MQLFVRAQELHTLEVTGQETVAQIKVSLRGAPRARFYSFTSLPEGTLINLIFVGRLM